MKRREFLKGAAALGAFNIVPVKVLWGATAPSNQLAAGETKGISTKREVYRNGWEVVV